MGVDRVGYEIPGNAEGAKFGNLRVLTQRGAKLQHFNSSPLCVASRWQHPSPVSLAVHNRGKCATLVLSVDVHISAYFLFLSVSW